MWNISETSLSFAKKTKELVSYLFEFILFLWHAELWLINRVLCLI